MMEISQARNLIDHLENYDTPNRVNSTRTYTFFKIERTGFAGPNVWFRVGDQYDRIQSYDEAKNEMQKLKRAVENRFDFRIIKRIIEETIFYDEDEQ